LVERYLRPLAAVPEIAWKLKLGATVTARLRLDLLSRPQSLRPAPLKPLRFSHLYLHRLRAMAEWKVVAIDG
jgi:hypothetical protein